MSILCHYCGKTVELGVEIAWKADKQKNDYCYKCWPEVEDNMKSVPWYKGYTLKPIGKIK